MSSDIDFDPTFTLMRLAWKTGTKIGKELRRSYDNDYSRKYSINSSRQNIHNRRNNQPLFDYDRL